MHPPARRVRAATAAAAGVLALAAVASCTSSGSSGTPSSPASGTPTVSAPVNHGSGAWDAQLNVALTSCFYQHHLIPAKDLKGLPVKNGRVDVSYSYHNGLVASTYRNGRKTSGFYFSLWIAQHENHITYQGKSMFDWLLAASSYRTSWPTSLCGPKPSPAPGTQLPGVPLYP